MIHAIYFLLGGAFVGFFVILYCIFSMGSKAENAIRNTLREYEDDYE